MQRELWAISLIVRAASVAIGARRKAPPFWVAWASFYLLTGVALRVADTAHHRHVIDGFWYNPLWYIQQIGTAILLIPVVRQTAKPFFELVVGSVLVALILSAAVSQAHHWPGSAEETVMELVGTATLALGFITAIAAAVRQTMDCYVLAGFLLLYSTLMLGGADYLQSAGIGCAWSVLEITAFAAWGIYFGHKTARL